jgi:hypothetical protein
MAEEASGNFVGNLVNALIVQIVGGILMSVGSLMNFVSVGFGYDTLVGLDLFPAGVKSVDIEFN